MNCDLEPIELDEDAFYMDESNNIYPCKKNKCNKLHKSSNKFDALTDAIYWLKPKRVAELLEQFVSEEIYSNNNFFFGIHYQNVLNYTINSIGGTCGICTGQPNIRKIGVNGFGNSSYAIYPNQITGSKLFLEIIELICKKFPQLINKSCYLYPTEYNISPIRKILNKYFQSDIPDTPICMSCETKSPEKMIKMPCGCGEVVEFDKNIDSNLTNHIHLLCLINQIEKTGDICTKCFKSFGSFTCPRGRISFPKLNIYKSPLISNYIFIKPEDKVKQLELACVYMIVDRVKELLDSFTDDEFASIINNFNNNGNGNGNGNGVYEFIAPKVIILTSNPYSNLSITTYPQEHKAISKLLISKSISSMEYSCDIDIQTSWGKYMWCGQVNSPTGSGFTLTNSNIVDIYGDPYTHMLLLELKPNLKLLNEADFYDIYDGEGGLYGYNIDPISSKIIDFKKIKPEQIGTELEIVFSKKKVLTKEEQEIVNRRLFRTPRVEIFRIKITIPDLIQYGDKLDCSICLDLVSEQTNKYISPCGHLFHLDCIFKYLESKNLLYPMYRECTKLCCGAKKIKPFECVVCKTLIIK